MDTVARRVGEADVEDLTELIAIRDEMNAVIQRAVDGLRADGYTWESIGAATGTTRQAALMKWGPTAKARRSVVFQPVADVGAEQSGEPGGGGDQNLGGVLGQRDLGVAVQDLDDGAEQDQIRQQGQGDGEDQGDDVDGPVR